MSFNTFYPEPFPVRHVPSADGMVSVNGQLIPLKKCAVPVNDRAVLYGDGVFEGARLIDGKVLFFEEHRERLYASAEKIGLPMPTRGEHDQWLAQALEAFMRHSKKSEAYIRTTVSRGMADMGINMAGLTEPGELRHIVTSIMLYPEELYSTGMRLIVAKTRKYPRECFDGSVKSLNYLNNIQAKREANSAGANDALMILPDGTVSEATVANVFGIKGKTLFTPSTECNCLMGITRAAVLSLAKDHALQVKEGRYQVADFLGADEVFLTGTGAGIMPIIEIDKHQIGGARPGSKTLELRSSYHKRLSNWCTPLNQIAEDQSLSFSPLISAVA